MAPSFADLVHSFDYRFYAIGDGGETNHELTIRDLEAIVPGERRGPAVASVTAQPDSASSGAKRGFG